MVSTENLERYQLAMFPLMLQALYNSKITLLGMNNRDGMLIDNGDCKRQTVGDIEVILNAFKSIGVKRRVGKKRSPLGHGYDLRHFHDTEIDKVVQLFNPDADERDAEVDEMKAKWNAHKQELENGIKARKARIAGLETENAMLRRRISELNEKIESSLPTKDVFDKLNDIINYPMSSSEIRKELKELLAAAR